MHAQRFLDACPDDVRAAVSRKWDSSAGGGSVSLFWGPAFNDLQVVFGALGAVRVREIGNGVRETTIDRLLQPTHPNSLASRIAAATSTNSGQGGGRMGDTVAGEG